MKRILLSLLSGFLFLGIHAQTYKVGTDVQLKNVLLEEFTGMRCGYCPEGHKIAYRMKEKWGERVSVVAIHCGYFALAGRYEPDFMVADGEILGDFLGGTYSSFPSGAINRRDWQNNGSYPMGRFFWEDYSKEVMNETAPVNLWAKAEIDAKTQNMQIRVEGYFTENVTEEKPRLNVMLTQNNVLGLQYGGGMGEDYPHQHMLRDAVTDAMGEELEQYNKGDYFVKEYVYPLPKSFKEVAVDIGELELVVFVTRGKGDVLNVISLKPDYVGELLPLRAKITPYKIPVSGGYRYSYVQLMLSNMSNSVLTTADFDVTLNGVVTESQWKGELAPFATAEIRIPVNWTTAAVESNLFQVELKALNGIDVERYAFEGTFEAPVVLPYEVTLHLNTDEMAEENTYALYEMDGTCVKTFGPFSNGETHQYEERLILKPNTGYCLEVTDAGGNGVYAHGNAVEFLDDNGKGLFQQYEIKDFGSRLFFHTSVQSGIHGMGVEGDSGVLYTVTGKVVMTVDNISALEHLKLPSGVYVLRTAKQTKKIVVK